MSTEINISHILFMILTLLFSGLTFIIIIKKNWLIWLNYPLDFNLKFRGKRLMGDQKTFKGPFVMGIACVAFGLAFYYLLNVELNFNALYLVFALMILGISYSLGELPNSFAKRQLNINPGGKVEGKYYILQKLIDNFDSLIACGLVYYFLFGFAIVNVLIAILVGGLLHLATDVLMKYWGLKK